jgi:DNA-binding CsgD family transcriptional regulator
MPRTNRADSCPSEYDGRIEPLTPREREVADLITQGLSNEQIAQHLVLTPGTVANHIAHILAKLRLQSRVQVAVKVATDKSRDGTETVLELLDSLQQVHSATARDAMQHAANVLSALFVADKVDAFFYDESEELLVALGTSETPLGKRQHELGLHRLSLSAGGRTAWVFSEGRTHRDGNVENDTMELIGIRRDLGVRSSIAAPIQVGGSGPRGVLTASSQQPEQFTENQLHLLQFVAYWVGLVARDHAVSEFTHVLAASEVGADGRN